MKQKKIFLILALLCTMVQAAWADITVTTENELLTAVQSSQTVTIGADINTASQGGRLDINNGKNVTINATKHDAAIEDVLTFTGTYAPVTIGSEGDNTKLFIGSNNTLYYPNATMNIGCQRAYFQLAEGLTADEPVSGSNAKQIRAFMLNFGDDKTTSISSIKSETRNNADGWYSIDGRRLHGKPTQRGIYINNGQKVVIK